jgi:hypothetical protein
MRVSARETLYLVAIALSLFMVAVMGTFSERESSSGKMAREPSQPPCGKQSVVMFSLLSLGSSLEMNLP